MSYATVLKHAMDNEDEVRIDRADAPSLKGLVTSIDKSGATIKIPALGETANFTYVDFKHMRGVTKSDWDI